MKATALTGNPDNLSVSDSLSVRVLRPGPTGCGAIKGRRPAYFPEFREHRETTVYDRAALAAGTVLQGPAIIEEPESTLVVGPGGACEVLPSGNIIVTIR